MTADPRLAEIFNRVADDIETVHGPAKVRATEPTARFGPHPSMGASWFPSGSNNGFKLHDRGSSAEIYTWSHDGDFASAQVQVRSWDAVEAILRAVLPPALSPLDRVVFAPLSEQTARGAAGDAAVSPVAGGGAPSTPPVAAPAAATRPSTPCSPAGVGGHQTPVETAGGDT